MATFLVLDGPNMNLLGKREPKKYGLTNLGTIRQQMQQLAGEMGHQLEYFQSNAEFELIDKIHENEGNYFIIFNPAAFTHTSIALRDALLGTDSRFIEVHISNPCTREDFRRISYFSDIAEAVIAGCGTEGYLFALQTANKLINDK